jgi:hypothetical protein
MAATIGAKGSDVYSGTGDARVDLSVRIVRGADPSEIRRLIQTVAATQKEDAFVLAFHSRNVRGGKGERDIFYELLAALSEVEPLITLELLPLVPEYGSWKDMFALASRSTILKERILDVAAVQLVRDSLKPPGESISLLGKWAPREHRAGDIMAASLAGRLFPGKPDARKQYRKLVAGLNRRLDTVETHMCDHTWAAIKPATVPGRAGKLYAKAFLNIKDKDTVRYADDPDRVSCADHFKEHFAAAAAGKATVHGSKTVFPHEVVKKARSAELTEPEKDQLKAVWSAMIADAGALSDCIVMADFSGSMQSSGTQGDTPYWVSMALGILGASVCKAPFQGRLMTFDSTPTWHQLPSADLFASLASIDRRISQGTSTDFQAAMELVLKDLKKARCRPGQEPKYLLVLTDMNWDQACASNGISAYTGATYRHHVKTAGWQTHLDMIKESFKRAGEDMHGPGQGLTPPQIVIWNLAANPTDFHATADTPGVSLLSGWSPTQFRLLQREGPRAMTPLETLRVELDDPQYDRIRDAIRAAAKKAA